MKGSETSFSPDISSLGYVLNYIADGLEKFLMTLRSQMLHESPSKRPKHYWDCEIFWKQENIE